MMNRLTWHHSGGTYDPNKVDLHHYHGAINGDCEFIPGEFSIEDNAPGRIRPGHYAAHTWKLNTGNIGLTVAAMRGAKWSDPFGGRFPVKPAQVDALMVHSARFVAAYGITVDRRFTLSHAEVQPTLGVTQRKKWDFDYDPHGGAGRDPIAIGDELRQELLLKLEGQQPAAHFSGDVVRRGDHGNDVRRLQSILGLDTDGAFGPITETAVIRFQKARGLLPDGIVGRMTWAELLR